jgi:hypothetical protein
VRIDVDESDRVPACPVHAKQGAEQDAAIAADEGDECPARAYDSRDSGREVNGEGRDVGLVTATPFGALEVCVALRGKDVTLIVGVQPRREIASP